MSHDPAVEAALGLADRSIVALRGRAASFVDVGRRAARDHHGRASSRFGRRAEELTHAADVIEQLRAVLLSIARNPDG